MADGSAVLTELTLLLALLEVRVDALRVPPGFFLNTLRKRGRDTKRDRQTDRF